MNSDSESLFDRFKKLHDIETSEERRINLIESDYPSLFFKSLLKIFKELVENLRKTGIELSFQSIEDPDGGYSNHALELKKRFIDSEEYGYDISFEDFLLKIEEEEERKWYYQQVYDGEGDVEFEEYKEYQDSIDEGDDYSHENEYSVECIGYKDLECANRISIISFKDLDILLSITQSSNTVYRFESYENENDYFDLNESDYGRGDESGYYIERKTITFSPNLNIRYFRGNFDQLLKEQNYAIEIDQNLNVLWGKENNNSLTNKVLSWFLEELEK